jgi:circadian clock protein KaiC
MATSGSGAGPQRTTISTGIPGLDHLLRGGLTPQRMYLVEGDPGTGKTTLAIQFLLEGKRLGEVGLYVTLSETATEIAAIADSHGWSLEGLEIFQLAPGEGLKPDDQYTLYHPSEIELGETIKAVLEIVQRTNPTRVVFDSLSEMRLLARDPLRYRRQILALKEFFAGRSCTVLLLDDRTGPEGDNQLQSISHGVLLLEQQPYAYGRARRRVRIVKFRGVPAVEGFHDFAIRRGGLAVFPQLVVSSGTTPPSNALKSGVSELDQLLGGGLTWGTTTLMIGPAGSGKSTIASQYAATLEAGVRGAIFLFEERLSTYISRCDALGMKMSALVESGRVTITQVEPGDVSPGEFSCRVADAVERNGARVVLIDSINGYLNAIPENDAPLARMHELLSYLNGKGVASLIILAQHGIVGAMMASPVDLSYLADCVVLLRFFEAEGRVRKAISVVKKRTGGHETTIRELQIGPGAVKVGEALAAFQGVLTGVPRYVGKTGPLFRE